MARSLDSTALNFFRKLGCNVYPTPHTLIATSCLSYLLASQFTRRKIASQKELEIFLNGKEHPLRDYAYHYWSFHTREADQPGLPRTVLNFLEKCRHYPCILDGKYFDRLERSHIIAYYGLQDISSHEERNRLTPIMQFTPLILACANGRQENVKALLSRKADVNTQAKNGHTALYTASSNGHEAVVSLLLSYNQAAVKTHLKDSLRVVGSVLHELVSWHDKVAVNKQTKDGQTPLFAASSKGHNAVVNLLLLHKDINVNEQTKDGRTPLFAASRNGHESVVELLLSHSGININTKTEHGWTALASETHTWQSVSPNERFSLGYRSATMTPQGPGEGLFKETFERMAGEPEVYDDITVSLKMRSKRSILTE